MKLDVPQPNISVTEAEEVLSLALSHRGNWKIKSIPKSQMIRFRKGIWCGYLQFKSTKNGSRIRFQILFKPLWLLVFVIVWPLGLLMVLFLLSKQTTLLPAIKKVFEKHYLEGSLQLPSSSSPASLDTYVELEKLASLKERGVLTEDEFTLQKKQLLGTR